MTWRNVATLKEPTPLAARMSINLGEIEGCLKEGGEGSALQKTIELLVKRLVAKFGPR
jgi:hypothetical protein